MAIPAILGCWFGRPTINLGFSGNGRMDRPVAELIAELDPAVYWIDCLPNMNAALVRERTRPMVEILLPGADLLGRDGEAATDGSHPSDLGFLRYALAYERVLQPLLGPSRRDVGLPF